MAKNCSTLSYIKKISCGLLVACFSLLLFQNTEAFKVVGANNLKAVQSNKSKSASYQVTAKLKPTALGFERVKMEEPEATPIDINNENPNNGPIVVNGGDGGRLGTANWSYRNRSAEVTAELQKKKKLHSSAPEKKFDPVIKKVDKTEIKTEITPLPNPAKKHVPLVKKEQKSTINLKKHPLFAEDITFDLGLKNLEPVKCEKNQPIIFTQNFAGFSWYFIACLLFFTLILMTIIIGLLIILVYYMWLTTKKTKKKNKSFKLFGLLVLILLNFGFLNNTEAGPITTPQQLIYEGELFENDGSEINGNYTFRFSFWDNENFETSDNNGGNINTAVSDYLNWLEVQSQEVEKSKFSFKLGTVTPFFAGLFDQTDIYLQVEVKKTGQPDSAYELIDLDADNDTIDRSIVTTIPFAFNADKLDFRDTGLEAGNIPYLNNQAKLDSAIIPNGVNDNTFKIDADGNSLLNDILSLQFGDILGKTLNWNGLNNRFEFNDTVYIDGDLVVTGNINGQSASSGPQNQTIVLSPRYPNSIIDADGNDNSGAMYEENMVINGENKNILKWTTKQTAIQDYDIIIRYVLPQNFAEFATDSLSLDFLTEGNLTDSRINFTLNKENNTNDFLNNAGVNLNSATWQTQNFTLDNNLWQAGDTMIFRIKMHSRQNLKSFIGDLKINYQTQ